MVEQEPARGPAIRAGALDDRPDELIPILRTAAPAGDSRHLGS